MFITAYVGILKNQLKPNCDMKQAFLNKKFQAKSSWIEHKKIMS